MKIITIGLVGLGTVGSGTMSILSRNAQEISRRVGVGIRVAVIAVSNINKTRSCATDGVLITDDHTAVITHPEIDIVVELMGGVETALSVVLGALDNDKHVVTANKALIALYGEQIFTRAQEKQKIVRFEAAVAGGIPIIKAIREGLSANKIKYLKGIINGTSNFILSQMQSQGCAFRTALKQAQDLGYVEADPTFDVEGTDAAHKLAILASAAFGFFPKFDQIYQEGISEIFAEDIRYAKQLGYSIKHVGLARKKGKSIEMRVHPTLIPSNQLIANVDGVMNAVLVNSDAAGETLYCGMGAGAEPTASAVVADVVDVIREMYADISGRVPYLGFQPESLADYSILPIEQVQTAYYVRMQVVNQSDAVSSVSDVFNTHNIAVKTLVEKSVSDDKRHKTIILLTENALEVSLSNAVHALQTLPITNGSIVRIRMETLS